MGRTLDGMRCGVLTPFLILFCLAPALAQSPLTGGGNAFGPFSNFRFRPFADLFQSRINIMPMAAPAEPSLALGFGFLLIHAWSCCKPGFSMTRVR